MPSFPYPKEQQYLRQAINLILENSSYFIVFQPWDLQYKMLPSPRKKKIIYLLKYEKYYTARAQCAFTALFSKLQRLLKKTEKLA